MAANPPRAQKMTPGQRAEHEKRLSDEAVGRLLASRVAQGLPAKVEDAAALARIAAILLGQEREQRSHGAGR